MLIPVSVISLPDILKSVLICHGPHFTVSIGAAAYPAAGNDYESLYLAADNAMYASKKSGKNRIYVDNGQQKKE